MRFDRHTSTVDAAAGFEDASIIPDRPDVDAHPDDNRPPAAHLVLPADDPWMVALAASVAEVKTWTR